MVTLGLSVEEKLRLSPLKSRATDANALEQGTVPGTLTISRTAAALKVHYSLGGSAANGIGYQSLPHVGNDSCRSRFSDHHGGAD